MALRQIGDKGNAMRQSVGIEPEQSYEISFRLFIEPGSSGRVVFDTADRFDETAQVVTDAAKSGAWLTFTRRFESGNEREVTIRVFPARGFDGRFFIDEVRLARSSESESAASRKGNGKNILFIVCDDLNTNVSSSGYDSIHTPTLAQFASEAMTFHRAFCQYPVCGPSRASFLNGLYPESTGVLP